MASVLVRDREETQGTERTLMWTWKQRWQGWSQGSQGLQGAEGRGESLGTDCPNEPPGGTHPAILTLDWGSPELCMGKFWCSKPPHLW